MKRWTPTATIRLPLGYNNVKELLKGTAAFVFVLLVFGRVAWTALGLLFGF